jgi:hypothetical protein
MRQGHPEYFFRIIPVRTYTFRPDKINQYVFMRQGNSHVNGPDYSLHRLHFGWGSRYPKFRQGKATKSRRRKQKMTAIHEVIFHTSVA